MSKVKRVLLGYQASGDVELGFEAYSNMACYNASRVWLLGLRV